MWHTLRRQAKTGGTDTEENNRFVNQGRWNKTVTDENIKRKCYFWDRSELCCILNWVKHNKKFTLKDNANLIFNTSKNDINTMLSLFFFLFVNVCKLINSQLLFYESRLAFKINVALRVTLLLKINLDKIIKEQIAEK